MMINKQVKILLEIYNLQSEEVQGSRQIRTCPNSKCKTRDCLIGNTVGNNLIISSFGT